MNNETYDADNGRVELHVAEATELRGFPGQVLGFRETQLLRYVWKIHLGVADYRVERLESSWVLNLHANRERLKRMGMKKKKKKNNKLVEVGGNMDWIFDFLFSLQFGAYEMERDFAGKSFWRRGEKI